MRSKQSQGLALIAGLAVGLGGTAPAALANHPAQAVQHIEAERSNAGFAVKVAWVRTLPGRFEVMEGIVSHDGSASGLGVDVRLDALSLTMNNPEHAAWAQSDEFFDSVRHPWIRFVAVNVDEAILVDGGELRGELTLRGVTRPVSLDVEPAACDRPGLDCAVVASGELKRSEFGMQARRFVVSDKVRLALSIRTRPADPAP